jgi:hypothetical protein
MNEDEFIDYYELLQLSSKADTDTVERVFRHLAKKFHPDNKESGDIDRFHLIVEAHKTLSNPESRAGYDVKHQDYWNSRWKLASEASNGTAFTEDSKNRESVLSILYVQRRRDTKKPGLGDYEVANLLSVPVELLEFHLWYLKEKGWVQRLETGHLAITALGVDQVEQGRFGLRNDHMLTAGGVTPEGPEERTTRLGSAELLEFPTNPDSNQ